MNMNTVWQWMLQSTWFKKYSGQIGAFCLGCVFMHNYHHQLKESLQVWGVTSAETMTVLWTIIGASGVITSIGLSMAKTKNMAEAKPKGE